MQTPNSITKSLPRSSIWELLTVTLFRGHYLLLGRHSSTAVAKLPLEMAGRPEGGLAHSSASPFPAPSTSWHTQGFQEQGLLHWLCSAQLSSSSRQKMPRL